MARITGDVRAACEPRDWQDSLAAIRRQHGRGTSRHLAREFGVSQRTAQRWLAGEVEHPGAEQAITDSADTGWLIADALATASGLDCGRVEVFYSGKSQGYRNVGTLDVDPEMHGYLEEAGMLYVAGNEDAAEQALSNAILRGYADQRARDNRDIVADTLTVGGFTSGFTLI